MLVNMKEKPSYYANIPADVRYCKELNANAKLLYGEITALCNKNGFCWAKNKYFADLYFVSVTSVSLWIKKLVENGFIETKKEDNKRKIYLAGALRKVKGGFKKSYRGALRKVKGKKHKKQQISPINKGLNENKKELNTTVNNTSNCNIAKTSFAERNFNSDKYIKSLLNDKKIHIQIIGKYFISKKVKFPTKKAGQLALKRELKWASEIAEYDKKQLDNAYFYVKEKFKELWTLSTIAKYISRV